MQRPLPALDVVRGDEAPVEEGGGGGDGLGDQTAGVATEVEDEAGGVGGLLAYVLWFRAITTLPVTSVSMLGLLSPMSAALLGVIVLGQTLDALQLTGFALALAAIVAGQRPAPVLTKAKGVLQ